MGNVGPLLDDGALYSGLDLENLELIQHLVCPEWDGKFEELPKTIRHQPFSQYGVGHHPTNLPQILGFVIVTGQTDQGSEVEIRHLL